MDAIDRINTITAANHALMSFIPRAQIEHRTGGIYVVWNAGDKTFSRRWQCRGQDFYPVWHRHRYWGPGGTATTALSQLVRWCQGKPVLPIASWRHWASETCRLLPVDAVKDLLAAGYPEHADCVLCGETITRGLDWWSLDGVSGPCCSWRSGCRQQAAE